MPVITDTSSPGLSAWKFAVRIFFHTFAIGHAGLVLGIFVPAYLDSMEMISQGTHELFFYISIGFFFFCAGPLVGFCFGQSALAKFSSFIALIGPTIPMVILFIMHSLSPTVGLGMGLVVYLFGLFVLVCIAGLFGAGGLFAFSAKKKCREQN